jgi:integrase
MTRDRNLTREEWARLFSTLGRLGNDTFGARILRVLGLTGAALDEVSSMCWAQLDLAAGIWHRGINSTDRRDDSQVILRPAALKILRSIEAERRPDEPLVFPERDVPALHRLWERVCADAKINDAQIDDLPRTVAAWQTSARLGTGIIGASGMLLPRRRRSTSTKPRSD